MKAASQENAEPVESQTGLLRMVDAAANRAGEGLRVVEDYVRFVLDDPHLTAQIKQLRHRLQTALQSIPAIERHLCRETRADVGTTVTTAEEQTRAELWSLAAASLKRVEQSLRSLEECTKRIDAALAAQFEQLRYETYTLERAIDITRTNLERLKDTSLCVLIDSRATEADFGSLVESLVSAGVGAIQLRDKVLDDRTLLARARRLRDMSQGSSTLAIINDRADIAALARADGVHVGQDELTVKDARTIVGPHALVGVSTHSIEQARQAVLDGANYIGVGPTFPSTTKSFDSLAGLELLRSVAAEIRLPSLAIGGIKTDNIAQVRAAGMHRVAVAAAVVESDDPAAAAQRLMDALH